MNSFKFCAASLALGLLAGCAGGSFSSAGLPHGRAAYGVIPAASPSAVQEDYRLGVYDKVSVFVYQEPDLSFPLLPIDASGNLSYPLAGSVHAQGMTTSELSRELASRLATNYLVNPQVTVSLAESISQRFTVEGEVASPGVYPMQGRTTLLTALAAARSPTGTAKLDQIVVFREVNGERMGAVFNASEIRGGKVADPEILGGDTIVVGFSALRGAWRDFLSTVPLFNVFRRW